MASVVKVEIVQSFSIWNNYQKRLDQSIKEKESVNQKLFWHGTSYTHPEKIYSTLEGFNIGFSRSGLWGKGLYFAETAKYSDKYSYADSDGNKGIFLVLVSIGKSHKLQLMDKELKSPPQGFQSV